MNDHTHTDKTLQGNNKIESAIAALQQEPSQEMLAHTLTVIRRRMNEHGELIIAIDPSSAASGLQVQAIQTDDGRKWWAAFTSFDEELKGSGSVMSTFLTDMKQLFNSEGALEEVLKEVIAKNPKAIADYKGGKEKALGALVGQTMKVMKGKANPGMVNQKLREMLK